MRSCIDFKCLPASPLDGERLSNGIRTVRHADWLKANCTTVYDLKAIPTPEKSVKRRLQDCDVLCSECASLIDLAEGNRPQRNVEGRDIILHEAEEPAFWLEMLGINE